MLICECVCPDAYVAGVLACLCLWITCLCSGYIPKHGRLYDILDDAWCALTVDGTDDWLQGNFGTLFVVYAYAYVLVKKKASGLKHYCSFFLNSTLYLSIDDCFFNAIGVSKPDKIPDNQLTASTYYSSGYMPKHGRLYDILGDAWCALTANGTDDWLQVDFGTLFVVCAVSTQGNKIRNQRITEYKLSSSLQGSFWTSYTDKNGRELVRFNVRAHLTRVL